MQQVGFSMFTHAQKAEASSSFFFLSDAWSSSDSWFSGMCKSLLIDFLHSQKSSLLLLVSWCIQNCHRFHFKLQSRQLATPLVVTLAFSSRGTQMSDITVNNFEFFFWISIQGQLFLPLHMQNLKLLCSYHVFF